MKNAYGWLAVGLVVVGLVIVTTPLLLAGGDVEAGKAIYAKKCASCHGKNGEGNAKMAEMLKVEIRDLSSAEVQKKSDEQLRKESVEGVGKMKPVKGLSDQDVDNLMAFVRSLKK